MTELVLQPGKITLAELRLIYTQKVSLQLDDGCFDAIEKSAKCVEQCIENNHTVYGINTGFGLLANVRIDRDQLQQLQHSLVLSHSAGVGKPIDKSTTRLMMVLKINSLVQGFSGIQRTTIERLITLFNKDLLPVIPEKGSVGASGDLAPLAHMSCLLLGEGKAWFGNEQIDAKIALEQAGLKPLTLAPKEGLALLNGTQASTALALKGLFGIENNFIAALVSGALSVDALMGSRVPFDNRIHRVRGHSGQIDTAAALEKLLERSEINVSHLDCEKVQDPYSLRCQPQVMGACLDQARHAANILLIEANAVSDNPLVFAGDNEILSGGNFHAQPVAFAADNLALCIAEIGAISERRIAIFMDKSMSGLPAFLIEKSGVNSGFMIAQVTAAALASENKSLAHPASVDSLPTSANQEDHVSMATFAARRLSEMNFNTAGVIAVEMLCAAQGIDFRAPLKTSPILQSAMKNIREQVAFYESDRYIASDIDALQNSILKGNFIDLVDNLIY